MGILGIRDAHLTCNGTGEKMKFVTSEADAEALGKQARHAIRDLGVLSESEPLVALAELKMTLAATHTQTGKAVQRARSLGVPEADVREALGMRSGEAYPPEFRLD